MPIAVEILEQHLQGARNLAGALEHTQKFLETRFEEVGEKEEDRQAAASSLALGVLMLICLDQKSAKNQADAFGKKDATVSTELKKAQDQVKDLEETLESLK